MIPDWMFKKIPTHLERLWHGKGIAESLREIVEYYPEAIQIFATLNVYRVNQLLLARCRGYNPEQKLEEGYWIDYKQDSGEFSPLQKEDILDFLVAHGYPLADRYIILPEVDPK